MFGGSEKTTPPGRYRVEIVSGEMREKSHERKVQEALNTGANMGWRLVSASTTNATGTYVTGVYWDTTPERQAMQRAGAPIRSPVPLAYLLRPLVRPG